MHREAYKATCMVRASMCVPLRRRKIVCGAINFIEKLLIKIILIFLLILHGSKRDKGFKVVFIFHTHENLIENYRKIKNLHRTIL